LILARGGVGLVAQRRLEERRPAEARARAAAERREISLKQKINKYIQFFLI
jgi:hypothetical protein